MLKKIIRKNAGSIFSLKVLYFYAKALGMVCFTITDGGYLKFSKKAWMFSIVYWTICSIGYMCFLTYAYRDVLETPKLFRGIIILFKYSAKAVLTAAFIKFQLKHHKDFLEVANKTIETLIRIAVLTKNLEFRREFTLIILGRLFSSTLVFVTDLPNLKKMYESKDPVFVVQNVLGYMLVIGTFITMDVICLMFITASMMYVRIGNHMMTFAERVEKIEISVMSSDRKKEMFEELCVELEECSKIYSAIFNTTNIFHTMVQLIILLNFNLTLISVIGGVYLCFVNYITVGGVLWFQIAQRIIQLVDFLILVFSVDLMVRRSKMPRNLYWEGLGTQLNKQWEKCVYQFLAQLRLEDLRMDVFGLFRLNRELILQVFSFIVGYLTILIQFSMLGYLKEDS